MNDRELLELAAKAAGITLKWSSSDDVPPRIAKTWHNWNPLTDDGDALRLAVKLHIDIRQFMYRDRQMDCLVDRLGKGFVERYTDDPYTATRRAIVRAAAEIGKEMS